MLYNRTATLHIYTELLNLTPQSLKNKGTNTNSPQRSEVYFSVQSRQVQDN